MTIAVIDDDDDLRSSLQELLESHGHEVRSFGRAEDALVELAAGFHPAVILLDLMMPGMSGWTFREHLLKNSSLAPIPVVVVTARTDNDGALKSLQRVEVVHKPFSFAALMKVVANAAPHLA